MSDEIRIDESADRTSGFPARARQPDVSPMMLMAKPLLEFWIPGRPQSAQKRGSNSMYVDRIRHAASGLLDAPIASPRVDVEVWFCAPAVTRPDVDNVLKPILDALVGVVYVDDRQVRSVRAVAIPRDDAITFGMRADTGVVIRLLEGKEFLVRIYEGLRLAGTAV